MRLATPLLKPDATLKNFFHYKSRFADIINLVCFDGQPILSRNSLSNEDTDMSTVLILMSIQSASMLIGILL